VITPSFNQGQFLEETILSVLHQDYPGVEYLVIDGGSTDCSLDVIRNYEQRLAYWESQPDRGQSNAINKGLGRASGEIVAWLNSDDCYTPGAVRAAVAALEAWSQVDLVFSDTELLVHETGRRRRHPSGPVDLASLLRDGNIIPQATAFIRRSALDRVGLLDESLHAVMDYDLWLRILRGGQARYLAGTVLATTRLHRDSKSIGRPARFGREFVRVLDKFYAHDAVPVEALHVRRQAYARVFYACAQLAVWHERAYGEAVRWLWLSAWTHPGPIAQLPRAAARAVARLARHTLRATLHTPGLR
jgi:GT2 family glycosyltransferase